MKKLFIPLLFVFVIIATFSQASAQNFTITVVNNGITTKHEKEYIKQVQSIFPQLANLFFTKKDVATYTVKIIIDSPQVQNVVNVAPAMASILDMHKDNSGSLVTDEEKHFYNVNYVQQVIRILLLDKNGTVITEKQSGVSPLFTQVYTRVFLVDAQTRNYSQTWGRNENPDYYYYLFMNNTPPKDFRYSTNVTQAIDSFVAL